MRHFIVCENNNNVNWNDPPYRRIVLLGSTYSEAELRKWARRIWDGQLPLDCTVEDIAKVISSGGWELLEKI